MYPARVSLGMQVNTSISFCFVLFCFVDNRPYNIHCSVLYFFSVNTTFHACTKRALLSIAVSLPPLRHPRSFLLNGCTIIYLTRTLLMTHGWFPNISYHLTEMNDFVYLCTEPVWSSFSCCSSLETLRHRGSQGNRGLPGEHLQMAGKVPQGDGMAGGLLCPWSSVELCLLQSEFLSLVKRY